MNLNRSHLIAFLEGTVIGIIIGWVLWWGLLQG
jgi:uncharacterized membrane protein YccC